MRWIIVLVALATLSAGCFGGADRLSQEEAEQVAEDAMRAFAADFADADGGALTTVKGTFTFGESDAFEGDVEFHLEWGLEGTASVALTTGGSFGLDVEIFCGTDSTVIVVGSEAVEARPDSEASCLNSFQDTGDPLQVEQFDDLDAVTVTPHGDGSVTAAYQDEQGNITVKIDSKGRVASLEIDTEEGGGVMDVGYGARRVIQVPDADERMPALISGFGSHNGEVYSWTGFGGENSEPFDEFEVRVMDGDEMVASFPVGADSEDNGFTFRFTDDGDGRFDGDDSFTIEHRDWTSSGQYEVVVWDLWADRATDDVPIPGFGLFGVLALLGAALVRR